MSTERKMVYTCDRCGKRETVDIPGGRDWPDPPEGWSKIRLPFRHYDMEACPRCTDTLTGAWDAGKP